MECRDIYIAGCSRHGGVFHFKLELSGKLRLCEVVHLDRPMYLAREGNTLYALLREPFGEGNGSGVCTLPLNGDGAFGEASAPVPTGGAVSAYLTVRGGSIYTANYISGDYSKLPDVVVPGAFPNEAAGSFVSHPHYIDLTPDGEYLAAADLGMDAVFLFTPSLKLVSHCRLPRGVGPRHLAFSPDGELAYCVNELASSVTVLGYSAGQFVALDTYPALPESYRGTSKAAAIRCVGNRLMVSHRGFDCITVFSREGESLTKLRDIPCGGRSPRDFDLTEGFIICANESSDNVAVLERGGEHNVIHSVNIPSPLCVLL